MLSSQKHLETIYEEFERIFWGYVYCVLRRNVTIVKLLLMVTCRSIPFERNGKVFKICLRMVSARILRLCVKCVVLYVWLDAFADVFRTYLARRRIMLWKCDVCTTLEYGWRQGWIRNVYMFIFMKKRPFCERMR